MESVLQSVCLVTIIFHLGTKASMGATEERRKLWESNPEVQKYILEKRQKAKLEEQKRDQEMAQRDESIKKRLMALEMKRREDYVRKIQLVS